MMIMQTLFTIIKCSFGKCVKETDFLIFRVVLCRLPISSSSETLDKLAMEKYIKWLFNYDQSHLLVCLPSFLLYVNKLRYPILDTYPMLDSHATVSSKKSNGIPIRYRYPTCLTRSPELLNAIANFLVLSHVRCCIVVFVSESHNCMQRF